MYDNAGKKLKSVVSGVTGILMAGSVLSGIGIAVLLGNISDDLKAAGFFIGLVIAVIGCITWWLVNLAIATFADMAKDVNELRAKVVGIPPEPSEEEKAAKRQELQDQYNMWTCSACGAKNLQHWTSCADCGTKKDGEQKQISNNVQTNGYCPKCGSMQQQGDTFCSFCGYKLK